ncbi:HalD/BesD family halogenase [Actinomadura terrae]|uniref:HalD/BesD family halogenase n=1 Tax=Actinomadura terrae TaxID=604353 RepID=UPI001FA758D1|nr:arpA protein [Actinomadura terrae]
MVNTEGYPLEDPEGGAWRSVVSRIRADLAKSGCSVLADFIHPALRETLREECAAIAPQAHDGVETVNAYNIDVRSPLPDGHPARITVQRGNSFVPRDRIPSTHLVHRLYSNKLFQNFVASCFGLPRVHELGDPLSGLCLNVVRPGMEHPWHFDTNEFTVSLLTQEPEEGGVFEYCPNIRTAREENFGAVRSVLTGDGAHLVRRLTLNPGDLQLFKGRYSLHRVTPVAGTRERHTAILAYSERPGVIGSVARTRQLFGRVLPEHLAAEGRAVRVDRLLD